MKYMLLINNEEALDNGDDPSLDETIFEIGELLRSGYYEVEMIAPVME